MSANYFKKTSSYTAENYSAIYIRKSLRALFFLINIFNIGIIKKMKYILKSPSKYFIRKYAYFYQLYNNNHKSIELDFNGFADFDIHNIPLGTQILNKYRDIYKNTPDNKTQYILDEEDLLKDKKLIDFATSEQILMPIAKYLGTAPVLHGVSMWRSKLKDKHAVNVGDFDGAPFFHMDALDTKCIRLFIYLSDVNDDTGPLVYIPKKLSKKLAIESGYIGGSMPDKKVFKHIRPEDVIIKTGKSGTMYTVDSTNCFHLGSRTLKNERAILHFSYASYHNRDELDKLLRGLKNRHRDNSLSSLSKYHISSPN